MDMKTGRISLIFALFIILQIVGCSSEPKIYVSDAYDKRNQHAAEVKLSAAAESVSKSLAELAEIERATHPQAVLPSPMDPKMIGMDQLASIDWSGPIAPLMKKIAEISGYKLHVLGNQPGIPILVSITAKDTPLADILRDADFQCGNKAKIVVYPASKIIELRYVKA